MQRYKDAAGKIEGSGQALRPKNNERRVRRPDGTTKGTACRASTKNDGFREIALPFEILSFLKDIEDHTIRIAHITGFADTIPTDYLAASIEQLLFGCL